MMQDAGSYADAVAIRPATGDRKPEREDESKSLGRKQRWFRAYESNKRDEMAEQHSSRQYYHDKHWTDAETQRLRARGQQPTVRNRIKRKIDFLVGVEQRLRRDPKAFPRTPKHELGADTATAGLRYACDINKWEKVSSQCMHDGLVPGIGVAFIGIEAGEPVMRSVQVDRFFYDPRSVEPDFSDARYMGLHLWMDVDEATEKWPDQEDRIEGMVDADNTQLAGLMSDTDREQQWGDFENRRVRVVEFWEKAKLAPHMAGFGWKYCFFTGDLYLEGGWSPYKGEKGEPDCPYEPWSPYIDEKGVRYGMVRTMKSVQDEINYSASKILHRIAADRIFYEEGAIEDVDEAGKQLARPDGKLKISRGEWGKTVGIIDQGAKLQGEAERFQMAAAEIENLGPNPGLVGKGTGVDGASGRALLAQRDSGMTELSPVFERHRDWKLRVYRKLWNRCKQAWTGEKWIRITDEDDSPQHIALNSYEMQPDGTIQATNILDQIDVDIVLNEGPDTITMNEELMQTLGNLGEAATGPLGKVMIELSNSPNKERLLKMLDSATAAPPEIQAMQKRMAQLEEMMAAVNVDKARAEIENKRADTFQKLVAASTPQQQQVDEFGNPSGPPPAAPNLAAAMQTMAALFPLDYGEPTLSQQAEMIAGQPVPDPNAPPEQQGGPPPQPAGMPQEMPAQPFSGALPDQQMPEQMALSGALPIDPGA